MQRYIGDIFLIEKACIIKSPHTNYYYLSRNAVIKVSRCRDVLHTVRARGRQHNLALDREARCWETLGKYYFSLSGLKGVF